MGINISETSLFLDFSSGIRGNVIKCAFLLLGCCIQGQSDSSVIFTYFTVEASYMGLFWKSHLQLNPDKPIPSSRTASREGPNPSSNPKSQTYFFLYFILTSTDTLKTTAVYSSETSVNITPHTSENPKKNIG